MIPSRTLVLLLACAGCTAAGDLDRTAAAIVGGVDSTADDDQVVLMLSHDPSRDTAQGTFYEFCSGTLVAPNLVLTARHCVSETKSQHYACDEQGMPALGDPTLGDDFPVKDTMVFTGAALPDTFTPATASAIGKQVVHDTTTTICNADLALVVLDREIPNAKLASLRLDGAIAAGDPLYAVGWGATEDGPLPAMRQRRDDVSVAVVGPSTEAVLGDMLADREMRVTESICQGDSGGPVFDPVTHAELGVVSRGNSGDGNGPDCLGTEHTLMRVPSFKDLIMQGFAAAGQSPRLEMQPDMAQPVDMAAPPMGGGGCAIAGSADLGAPTLALALLAMAAARLLRRRRAT